MTTQGIALFSALGTKMDFLNQRQGIIAQNVSNADTPGYRPQDLVEPDFGKVLKKVTNSTGVQPVRIDTTNGQHMPAPGMEEADVKKQKETYEVALAGNAVVMEEQLIKANENIMDYNLMTNLYQKNIGLIKTAIGTK